jgi:hypothetical protein
LLFKVANEWKKLSPPQHSVQLIINFCHHYLPVQNQLKPFKYHSAVQQ